MVLTGGKAQRRVWRARSRAGRFRGARAFPAAAAFVAGLAACNGDETISGYADPDAIYRLEELFGDPFPAQATISFPEEGRIAGEGPCNRFSAAQRVPYPWFEAGQVVATRRACPDLAAETAFFAALGAMTLAEISGPVLILSDEAGRQMVFRAGGI